MKKKSIVYLTLILFGGIVTSTSVAQAQQVQPKKEVNQKQEIKYTCPMHPEVVQNEPGKCPKCGMDLVVKRDKQNKMMHMEGDSLKMRQGHTMHDSTMMHHDYMMHDSTKMQHGHMMHDSTIMHHDHLMHDSTGKMHPQKMNDSGKMKQDYKVK